MAEENQEKTEETNLREDTSEHLELSNKNKIKTQDESKKPSGVLDKDNTIFIGIKPFMNYVTAVVMQFKNKGQTEVIVSARGKFISKAVDVVEVARRTFLKEENIQVKDIKISSEAFENKEGKRIHVSAIEIFLIKG